MKQDDEQITPLRYALAPSGGADIASALLYLDDLIGQGVTDPEAADRFEERLDEAISAARDRIAREIAENGRPFDSPDEAASYAMTQTVYRLKVETSKKRSRRSSAGLWYVLYALRDTDGDGVIDTLRVHRVLHSAARPLSKERNRGSDDT